MTPAALPTSPTDFASATWGDVLPFYEELAERPLTRENVDTWLEHWSRLEELLSEAAALAMIAYTCDTADPQKEAAYLRFSTEILPQKDEQGVRLAQRLLDLGYRRADLDMTVARFRTTIGIFREANVPLFAEIEKYGVKYQKITGSFTVEWDGREKTLPQLQPFLRSPDRAVRERAFRALNAPYLSKRDELSAIFDRMFELRDRVARNAGFANFQDYIFQAKFRFDYTPADCERLHRAIEQVVGPALERLLERRRRQLGLDSLRPWDVYVDPARRQPLRPFTSVEEFIFKAGRVFWRIDPALGRDFQVMVDERLLDLESRKGKAPGGYCETLPFRGRPFIFMNAAATMDDVTTLFHEAGHAFHAFAAHRQPLIWQRHPGSETAELASMSMELLASPYLSVSDGGFFSEEEAGRARVEHFEDILFSLAHIASVDAFQSWLYTSGHGCDPDARDEAWLAIRGRFEQGIDWGGLERERIARWYRQLHIFLYPFYYIEYGLAQIGALQVWRNSLEDQRQAVAKYRSALSLGSTKPLPELFAAAGVRFTFETETLRDLVALVERHLESACFLDGAGQDSTP
ncbi:MAG: M3 family oligoendopeptidase [Acidobacteria bacterium]|nr:M3 family oligoendopeptidase [Acidobacteriota bacterium]